MRKIVYFSNVCVPDETALDKLFADLIFADVRLEDIEIVDLGWLGGYDVCYKSETMIFV
ncbi:hypothetical protein [Brevibacillus borstelensis]|uniref:hypothetical protein n=1 Tax=Brevibacillus borstelensis TaxID=45462 RepID=UPI00203E4B4D|nr:hypothetical protein [Brevibacillus borstelensis]MCM3473688.1 hypothetical protein [Brevibacillus borstelensis]MED1855149.1 hypothetical protein [Brevibacillus borstelensis]